MSSNSQNTTRINVQKLQKGFFSQLVQSPLVASRFYEQQKQDHCLQKSTSRDRLMNKQKEKKSQTRISKDGGQKKGEEGGKQRFTFDKCQSQTSFNQSPSFPNEKGGQGGKKQQMSPYKSMDCLVNLNIVENDSEQLRKQAQQMINKDDSGMQTQFISYIETSSFAQDLPVSEQSLHSCNDPYKENNSHIYNNGVLHSQQIHRILTKEIGKGKESRNIKVQEGKTLQNLTQQSSLCNMASVQNQLKGKGNENVEYDMQLGEARKENVRLIEEMQRIKNSWKKEKLETKKQLQEIEENYQKYAFYYTKYLEEKIQFDENKHKLHSLQQQFDISVQKSSQYQESLLDLVKGLTNTKLNESVRSILYQWGLKAQSLELSNEITTLINNLKKNQNKDSSYNSLQNSHNRVSENKRSRRSSTPKTQFRYNQQTEDDDQFSLDQRDSKSDQPLQQEEFPRRQSSFSSLNNLPQFVRASQHEHPVLSDNGEDNPINTASSSKSVTAPYDKAEQDYIKQSESDNRNIYEYTLKSCQINEQISTNRKDSDTSNNQIVFFCRDIMNQSEDERAPPYDPQWNSKEQFLLQNPQQTFNQELILSKLDTFSPKLYQEMSSMKKEVGGMIGNEIRYSVEFAESEGGRKQRESMAVNLVTISENERKIEIGTAIKGFIGVKEQDLSFKQGEKILIETKIKGSSWYFGSIGSRKGWFPASCVSVEDFFI